MKRALIVGSRGQDGRLLFDQLAADHYALLGIDRQAIDTHGPVAAIPPVDILDPAQVLQAVRHFVPDEIYYLAAFHHSAQDQVLIDPIALYGKSHAIHVEGFLHFLEACRRMPVPARVFYAASSHVFGLTDGRNLDENALLHPRCVYGITKTAGVYCCRLYRQAHGVPVSIGFLFNHESPYRAPEFLSQRIVRAAVAIHRGLQDHLVLGNLSAIVDWGDAADYTRAMRAILNLKEAGDFIIASGIPHTVRDFAAAAFSALGLDWSRFVSEDSSLVIKSHNRLVGNPAKLLRLTDWRPTRDFRQMIEHLVRAESHRQGLLEEGA